jgi:oligosaccharide repeat unit polymerase
MAITSKLNATGEYQYGSYTLSSVLFGFIPRALWPGKPPAGALLVNDYFWPNFVQGLGAPASTMVGETYWEAGLLGVGIGFLVLGAFLRAIEAYRKKCGFHVIAGIIYAVVVWYFSVMSNEAFAPSFGSFLLYLIVCVALYKFLSIAVSQKKGLQAIK